MKINKETNASEQVIAISKLIIISILILGLPFILWTIGFIFKDKPNILFKIFLRLPEYFNNMSILYATLLGMTIVRNGAFQKGTKYYPTKYGKWKLAKIIENCCNLSEMDKKNLFKQFDIINKPQDDYNNKYFQLVNDLQKQNADFKMVWNDFNYYSSINKPSKSQIEYMNKIRIYIYKTVIDEHNKTFNQG